MSSSTLRFEQPGGMKRETRKAEAITRDLIQMHYFFTMGVVKPTELFFSMFSLPSALKFIRATISHQNQSLFIFQLVLAAFTIIKKTFQPLPSLLCPLNCQSSKGPKRSLVLKQLLTWLYGQMHKIEFWKEYFSGNLM